MFSRPRPFADRTSAAFYLAALGELTLGCYLERLRRKEDAASQTANLQKAVQSRSQTF